MSSLVTRAPTWGHRSTLMVAIIGYLTNIYALFVAESSRLRSDDFR